MWQLLRILTWRSNQSVLLRWLEAVAIFAVAFALRYAMGWFEGFGPFITFYPAVLISALLLGWKEALFVLLLSVTAGSYFFLPSGLRLLLIGWVLAGSLNVAIVIALKALALALAEANERQRILFQELQHRVANTLQSTIARLDLLRRTLRTDTAATAAILDNAIQQMSASADVHRRLHDPEMLNRGPEPILRDVVASIVNEAAVDVTFYVEELDLSFDQLSVIAMLVIEATNNAMKHVFRQNLGSRLQLTLVDLPDRRAKLVIKDDGPGTQSAGGAASPSDSLGMRIIQGLAEQIRGTVTIRHQDGTEVVVEFPRLGRPAAAKRG